MNQINKEESISKPVGRPSKMTKLTVKKLEEAFSLGCSDVEACFYADISKQTLYTYQEQNQEFIDRKEALKKNPVLLARQSVIKGMATDPLLALKYLERKERREFSLRSETETNGDSTPIVIIMPSEEEAEKFRKERRERGLS